MVIVVSKLPKGWSEEILVNYLHSVPTGVPNYDGEKEYYSTGSVNNGTTIPEGIFSFATKPSRANKIVQKGDLLQARMKATNKALLIDDSLSGSLVSTGFIQIRIPENKYKIKFAFYYLNSDCFLLQRDDLATGSTQEALTDKNLKKIKIPVPPIDEQKRIVKQLELLLGKIQKANERLEKIPTILKRFRQSVLFSACSGRLTADWREENVCGDWENKKLIDMVKERGIFDGPFGSNLKTSDYVNMGVRVVRLENVGVLNFIKEKESYISIEKYQTLLNHTVFEEDVIFSSFISESVRVCQIPKLDTPAIAKADCFCIRPDRKMLVNKYLCYALSNPNIYDNFVELVHGATRPRINTSQLKNIFLAVPSLPEQDVIVRRVDKLFALADKIEVRYMNAKALLVRAEKAIYAKAFRGELVRQEEQQHLIN